MIVQRYAKWLIAMVLTAVACAAWMGISLQTPQPVGATDLRPARRVTVAQPAVSHALPPRSATPAKWKRQPRTMILTSAAVDSGPKIDGMGTDPAWAAATSVTTLDALSQRPVALRSIHTRDRVYLLVTYPDATQSVTHKSFRWDTDEGVYKPMADREDTFVFKWSMQGEEVDLALRNGSPHRADVWFWKAWRTDPIGYADDKSHLVSPVRHDPCVPLAGGPQRVFLHRVGDESRSAYVERVPFEFTTPVVSRYTHRAPSGSRADVRAKGRWADGVWTIEFTRRLDTGGTDDVAFAVDGHYLFGISCYEISAGTPEPTLNRPLYTCGDVFDRLILEMQGEDGP